MRKTLRDYSKKELEKIIKDCSSKKEVLKKLGYCVTGNNQKILKQMIEEYQINTSHFTQKRGKAKDDKEIFKKDAKVAQSVLRKRFMEREFVEYKCDVCGLPPEWQGRPLALILDHINGNNTDNRLDNLHWVCPNCNSQLATTGFTGVIKYDNYGNRMRGVSATPEEVEKFEIKFKSRCTKCGRPLKEGITMCPKCIEKEKRDRSLEKMRVSREELKDLIRNHSFVDIGKKFGVSDNAVRRWCKKYELPFRKEEIDKFTKREWNKV